MTSLAQAAEMGQVDRIICAALTILLILIVAWMLFSWMDDG